MPRLSAPVQPRDKTSETPSTGSMSGGVYPALGRPGDECGALCNVAYQACTAGRTDEASGGRDLACRGSVAVFGDPARSRITPICDRVSAAITLEGRLPIRRGLSQAGGADNPHRRSCQALATLQISLAGEATPYQLSRSRPRPGLCPSQRRFDERRLRSDIRSVRPRCAKGCSRCCNAIATVDSRARTYGRQRDRRLRW